ncbi:DUF4145 domain-containing protein [Flavobacteriaceae bacterium M23B6Z8]
MNIENIETEWRESIPKFDCPTCEKGILNFEKKDIVELEDGISKQCKILELEPTYYSGKFTLSSKCTNPECEETAIIVGKTSLVSNGWYSGGFDPEEGIEIPPHEMYKTLYKLELTEPAIQLFNIPEKVSDKVRNKLKESFKLFWIDKSACGNKIRASIEILLDDLKVRKTRTKNRKRTKLTLHKRIELFKEKKSSLASNLLAIKWIGNSSSHGISNVSTRQIIDSYKILEYVLTNIYDIKESEIKNLTKKINKRKR